jgi:hypothetical protein
VYKKRRVRHVPLEKEERVDRGLVKRMSACTKNMRKTAANGNDSTGVGWGEGGGELKCRIKNKEM